MKIPLDQAPLIHYLCEVLAFFIGVRIYYYLKRNTEDPISDTNRLWIMLGAMLGALAGSRIIAMFETPELISQTTWLSFYQNKTVAGGFLGGLFGVELTKKIIGITIASGDLYVIPIVVALSIGRLGCFVMGIKEPTYGIPTSFFTGMNLGDGISRHPVSLYEILFMLLLLALFFTLRKATLPNGDRFKLFMVLYFLYRFGVEFLKPYHPLALHLSIIHWISLFLFFYYHTFFIRIYKIIFNAQ